MDKNIKIKNALNGFDLMYSKESGYEHGFFKKLAESGKDTLKKTVKVWLESVEDDLKTSDNEALEVIFEFTVAFFQTALKDPVGATALVPIDSNVVLNYDLDKNKSVFIFKIFIKK